MVMGLAYRVIRHHHGTVGRVRQKGHGPGFSVCFVDGGAVCSDNDAQLEAQCT